MHHQHVFTKLQPRTAVQVIQTFTRYLHVSDVHSLSVRKWLYRHFRSRRPTQCLGGKSAIFPGNIL